MNADTGSTKVYVPVLAYFDEAGVMQPKRITWEDGRTFDIDRVLDVRQAAAMKAGGQGDRYTIRVCGKESFLFFERSASPTGSNIGRWFVERKRSRGPGAPNGRPGPRGENR